MTDRVRTAVLLSGSGRTLENFMTRIEEGELPLEIVAVISSRTDVRGVELAANAGLNTAIFQRRDFPSRMVHNFVQNTWLMEQRPELILLCGYLSYYQRPDGFDGPVLNIHPALLPRFGGKGMYGDHVHRAVLEAGETESGCTVHHVTEVYDAGAIIAQQKVWVLPDDDPHTLAARVFAAECELYPRVVREIAEAILEGRSG